LNEALRFFEDRSKLAEELHREYPADVSFKNGLAISYARIGNLLLEAGEKENAIQKIAAAKSLWKQLEQEFPEYPEFSNNLAWAEQKLKEIDGQ
jgi:hypothetical protein